MSQAFSGYGLFFKKGNGDGLPLASPPVAETFTAIDEIQQVEFTGSKVDIVEVTHTQSPNRRREYIATLIDSGELTFTANFVPGSTTQTGLQATMDSCAVVNYEVVLPSSLGTFKFAGIITKLDRGLQFDKEAKITGSVKITGPIDFA